MPEKNNHTEKLMTKIVLLRGTKWRNILHSTITPYLALHNKYNDWVKITNFLAYFGRHSCVKEDKGVDT